MYTQEELQYASNIIQNVAQEYGVSEEEVRTEMEKAMLSGMHNSDPDVQMKWASFHFAGPSPTVEEFILWMTNRVQFKRDTSPSSKRRHRAT